MSLDRAAVITAVESSPGFAGASGLAGLPSMKGYRAALAQCAPSELADATLLHALLDDVPGVSLVSGYTPRLWHNVEQLVDAGLRAPGTRRMLNTCIAFAEGSPALKPDGTGAVSLPSDRVGHVNASGDPLAWHELANEHRMALRRSRRLDVWLEGDTVHMDAYFQDANWLPDGGRQALHEYAVTAQADLARLSLQAVRVRPLALPHDQCPAAIGNVDRMLGTGLVDLRRNVLRELRGIQGCTHLNDQLRSLADVPALLAQLQEEEVSA